MGTVAFLLNCFVLGDDEERVFPIEIAKDKNVGILKDLIKEKKAISSATSMPQISTSRRFAGLSMILLPNSRKLGPL